ncbi:MAG: phosphoglycerate dehydrogenase [Desulfofustis sp.]|nr:hypothetical protein [Desulfofustis sp.]NNK14385.1 phosphoglycerate dehydrogenase [Desulfofustis sp.]
MKIAFHGTNAENFHPGFEKLLSGSYLIRSLSDELSEPAERKYFEEAEVIIGTSLSNAQPRPTQARLYQVAGAGYDGIDFSCLPPKCTVCNCFGHEDAITEYVMSAVLTKYVPLAEADKKLRKGGWDYQAGRPEGLRRECSGTAIGIVGYGHIGSGVARRAKVFNMEVHIANRSTLIVDHIIDHYYPLADLSTFLAAVDVVVVALPLSNDTSGLIDQQAFAAMRPDSLIINVGRGPVIKEKALYEALKDKQIGGAVIDTWYVYPTDSNDTPYPGNYPFHTLDNIIITPHMSGWTWGTIRRRQEVMAENIHRLENGEPLLNIVKRGEY